MLAMSPFLSTAMRLEKLSRFTSLLNNSEKMPVLFLGHGSPMNAIEENEFVQGFREAGKHLPSPSAILCISAHWETRGTFVTVAEHPKTIHDFRGFPQALFDVQYPAPGSPDLARETQRIVQQASIGLDEKWGLDHGAWSVIKHLYPLANVPIVQLSLDYSKGPEYHYALAKELASLRRKGVLIIGSGNMVHNLGKVAWEHLQTDNFGFDWAIEASDKMKTWILNCDHPALINYRSAGAAFDLAIPTPEHYLPLLYCCALQEKEDTCTLFNDKALLGSLTMTSVKWA